MRSVKLGVCYILYIYVRYNEVRAMTLKDLEKIDEKLTKIYENQITTNAPTPSMNWVDRSETLLEQMNFIALNNKSFLNLK